MRERLSQALLRSGTISGYRRRGAAALRARIHYLDVTAEQSSAQAMFDSFGNAAVKAGVVVIPAMGFYGGFANRNTVPRLVIEDRKFVPLPHPAPQTFWDFPEPFGHQGVSEVPLSEFLHRPPPPSGTSSHLSQQCATSRSSRFHHPATSHH